MDFAVELYKKDVSGNEIAKKLNIYTRENEFWEVALPNIFFYNS